MSKETTYDLAVIAEIERLAAKGFNKQEVADELGLTRHAVRRRAEAYNIDFSPAEKLKAERQAAKARQRAEKAASKETPSTHLERAERAAEGVRTAEDQLRDSNDELTRENRRLHSAIKALHSRVLAEDRMVSLFEHRLSEREIYVPPMRALPDPTAYKGKPHEFAALISDAHGGELVDKEQAMGISYNWDICVRRLEYIRDTVVTYAETRSHGVSKLHLPIMGDMLSGNIHDELRITNEMTLPEQVIMMGDVLAQLVTDLSSVFPEIEVTVLPGNHPRLYAKPQAKGNPFGFEYMMGHYVKTSVKGLGNVKVDVPLAMVPIIEVAGHRVGLMHGDGVASNSFAGIPFYGLRQRREAIQALMSSLGHPRIDMLAMGHFHQYIFWRGECDVIINPSIKGPDEYSMKKYLAAHPAEQVLLEFHPDHGLVSQNLITLSHIS